MSLTLVSDSTGDIRRRHWPVHRLRVLRQPNHRAVHRRRQHHEHSGSGPRARRHVHLHCDSVLAAAQPHRAPAAASPDPGPQPKPAPGRSEPSSREPASAQPAPAAEPKPAAAVEAWSPIHACNEVNGSCFDGPVCCLLVYMDVTDIRSIRILATRDLRSCPYPAQLRPADVLAASAGSWHCV